MYWGGGSSSPAAREITLGGRSSSRVLYGAPSPVDATHTRIPLEG